MLESRRAILSFSGARAKRKKCFYPREACGAFEVKLSTCLMDDCVLFSIVKTKAVSKQPSSLARMARHGVQMLRSVARAGSSTGELAAASFRSRPALTAAPLLSRPAAKSASLGLLRASSLAAAAVVPNARFSPSFSSSPSARGTDGTLGKTALHDFHVQHGGKMVEFGGYSMPLQYSSATPLASHKHVRSECGLFDVGHMVPR